MLPIPPPIVPGALDELANKLPMGPAFDPCIDANPPKPLKEDPVPKPLKPPPPKPGSCEVFTLELNAADDKPNTDDENGSGCKKYWNPCIKKRLK